MKNKYLFSRYLILCLLIYVGILVSCSKKEDDLGDAPRLFRPVLTGEITGNTIKITWPRITEATSFSIDVSKDTFKTIYRSVETDSSAYVFTDLDWDQGYFIRIKCNGVNKSSEYFYAHGEVVYPTLLLNMTDADVTDVAARPQWLSNKTVFTSMKVYKVSNDSLVTEITITAEDTTNKYKEIYGLQPNTQYKVVIYAGEKYEGRQLFTTAESQIFDIPVDLRNIDDATASVMLTAAYFQGLEDGSTVILKRGMTYVISGGISLEKSVTFTTGLGFGNNLAVFDLQSGNFNITTAANVSLVKFVNVNLIGGTIGYPNRYILNINTVSTVGNIVAEGCTIKGLRGIVRTQAGPTIDSVIFNNCIIDSIAGFGIVNSDNATSLIKNIRITNSTISDAQVFLVNTKSDGTESIYLENCTFCYLPYGTRYMFDYNGRTVINGITIKNCIFGPGKQNTTVNPVTSSINGFRGTANFTTGGNYKTSDLTWALDATSQPIAPLAGLDDYTGASTDLFKDPANDDFTIKDNSFVGKSTAGDPRWRK